MGGGGYGGGGGGYGGGGRYEDRNEPRGYGGRGGDQQSHPNFGMRRDRRDSDRQQRQPEEFKEATAGEIIDDIIK